MMGSDKILVQCRISKIVDAQLTAVCARDGLSEAAWVRRLLVQHFKMARPPIKILQIKGEQVSILRDDLHLEILKRDTQTGLPLEGAIEGDDREDQGWNYEPGDYHILIGDSLNSQEIYWTFYDNISKRLIVRFKETRKADAS